MSKGSSNVSYLASMKPGRSTGGGDGTDGGDSIPNMIGREEHDAKLEALRQEMRADNATLRSDIASLSAAIQQTVGTMALGVADLKVEVKSNHAELKGAVAGVQGKFEGLEGKIDGVKSSITALQWIVGVLLAAAALYVAVKQADGTTPPPQVQPIVIQTQHPVPPPASPASK